MCVQRAGPGPGLRLPSESPAFMTHRMARGSGAVHVGSHLHHANNQSLVDEASGCYDM